MAHYALLDTNNIVVRVITGIDENDFIDGKTPEDWYAEFTQFKCIRTSYNHNIRKQYAGVGYSYNEEADVFIKPQPFPSWVLDEKFDWQPPKPMPTDQGFVDWNEELGEWINVEANA